MRSAKLADGKVYNVEFAKIPAAKASTRPAKK